SSAALRLTDQPPFVPRGDLSYRRVAPNPAIGPIVIDHHSGIGTVPKMRSGDRLSTHCIGKSRLAWADRQYFTGAFFLYGRLTTTRTGGNGACASAWPRIGGGQGRSSAAGTVLTVLS